MPRKQPELTREIIVTYAEDTPENRALFMRGIRALNDVIDELELKHRQDEQGEKAS